MSGPFSETFRREHDLARRQERSARLKSKYEGRVPIILDAPDDLNLDTHKFIVNADMTVSQFLQQLRKDACVPPTQSLYLIVTSSATAPPLSQTIRNLAGEHGAEDGFTYLTAKQDNVFGGRE